VRVVAAALLLAACGRLRFDALGATDAAGAADACTPVWSAPQPIAAVNSTFDDWEPELSNDGNWLVFSSDRTADTHNHLYLSQRMGDTFGPPRQLIELTTAARDQGPAWDGTGANLYFSSDRSGTFLLYESAFDGASFAPPVQITTLATQSIVAASISADDLEMVWGDSFSATASLLDFVVRDSPATPWPDSESVAPATSPAGWPSLSGDRLTVYFQSQRSAVTQIYYSTRASVTDVFGTPALAVPFADPTAGDGDPFISHDGNTFLFTSDRAGGTGLADIWISTRACP